MDTKGKRVDLLDTLTVERAQYQELRSTKSGSLLGNRMSDGDSLYLFLTPNNSKSWRMDYRFPAGGRKRVIVFGSYPAMGLGEARKAKLRAKLMLAEGKDPGVEREKQREEAKRVDEQKQDEKKNTFRSIASEWLQEVLENDALAVKQGKKIRAKSAVWKANTERWISWANDEFGNKPITDVKTPDILSLIKRIAKTTPPSAEFCRVVIQKVFDYAIAETKLPDGLNPAASLRGRIIVPPPKHRPKLEAKDLPAFLSALNGYNGAESVKLGVYLLLHLFPRKEELAGARWSEIDFDAAEWRLPAERTKTAKPHTVPLSPQALKMFLRLKELAGDSEYVFPTRFRKRPKPMTGKVFNYVLNSIGYEDRLTPHGTRATAASVLADAGFDVHVIDSALAHTPLSKTQRAYLRNDYKEQRVKLMASWSDMLDAYAAGGHVIPINTAKVAA